MKGIVAYYSAGGNTHKIARAIYRGMKEIIECDVGMVNDLNPQDMDKYDLIGIGSPLWYYRETANVRRFVSYMPDMTGKLGFIFCAHGTLPSGIFHAMTPPIQRKGVTIIGWNDWFGSNYSSISSAKPNPVDGHPDEIDIKGAEDWGKEMAERAQRIYAGEKDLIPEVPHGKDAPPLFQPHGVMQFFGGLEKPHRTVNMELCKYPECTLCIDNCEPHALDFSMNPPSYNIKTCINCCLCDRMCPQGAIEIPEEEMQLMRTQKVINMEKCKYPECTLCVDYCSMDSIDFSVNPPVFKRSCEGDNLCFMICPEGAIEVTNFDITHGQGHGPRRRRPGTPYTSMLDRLEEQGLFRRMVPKEEIGTGMRPIDITSHPIYNIQDLIQETPLPIDYGRRYSDSKE